MYPGRTRQISVFETHDLPALDQRKARVFSSSYWRVIHLFGSVKGRTNDVSIRGNGKFAGASADPV